MDAAARERAAEPKDSDGTITVEVARRQADGSWRWVLDQPRING